jgi:hypothetical protein
MTLTCERAGSALPLVWTALGDWRLQWAALLLVWGPAMLQVRQQRPELREQWEARLLRR